MPALKLIFVMIVAVPIVMIGIAGLGISGGMMWFFTSTDMGQTSKLMAETVAPQQADLIDLQIYLWAALGFFLVCVFTVIMCFVVLRRAEQSAAYDTQWENG